MSLIQNLLIIECTTISSVKYKRSRYWKEAIWDTSRESYLTVISKKVAVHGTSSVLRSTAVIAEVLGDPGSGFWILSSSHFQSLTYFLVA